MSKKNFSKTLNEWLKKSFTEVNSNDSKWKVIAQTRSGRPIYENTKHPPELESGAGYSAEDHIDAHDAHVDVGGEDHITHALDHKYMAMAIRKKNINTEKYASDIAKEVKSASEEFKKSEFHGSDNSWIEEIYEPFVAPGFTVSVNEMGKRHSYPDKGYTQKGRQAYYGFPIPRLVILIGDEDPTYVSPIREEGYVSKEESSSRGRNSRSARDSREEEEE